MRSLTSYKKQGGFTIVELLIVIVVIGILAALVITTFTGIQQRARNTERETDIKAIHGQLEAYFATNGVYPTLDHLIDDTWRPANGMGGLDEGALHAPNQTGDPAATATLAVYGYAPAPANCNDVIGDATADCSSYVLTAVREGSAGDYVKNSLN